MTDPTNPSTTITMTQAQSVTANFAVMLPKTVTKSGSVFTFAFIAGQGATYRLERTQSLTSPNWQNVIQLTASTTGQVQLSDTSAPPAPVFYRVHLLPQ